MEVRENAKKRAPGSENEVGPGPAIAAVIAVAVAIASVSIIAESIRPDYFSFSIENIFAPFRD